MKAKLTIRAVHLEAVGDENTIREIMRTLDGLFTGPIRDKPVRRKSGQMAAFDSGASPASPLTVNGHGRPQPKERTDA